MGYIYRIRYRIIVTESVGDSVPPIRSSRYLSILLLWNIEMSMIEQGEN